MLRARKTFLPGSAIYPECGPPIPSTEDTVKKLAVFMLLTLLVGMCAAAQAAVPQETKEKTAVSSKAKGARWSGTVVRVDKESGYLDVRKTGGTVEKRVYFNDATKWTKGKEAIQLGDVKEQDKVVCLGKYEGEKFIAERINLRMQK
jgi:hypothetical protein